MCVIPSLDKGKRLAGNGVLRRRHPFYYLDISNNADAGVPVPPVLCMGVGELAGENVTLCLFVMTRCVYLYMYTRHVRLHTCTYEYINMNI